MSNVTAPDLRAHVIWLPILSKDNRQAAQMNADIFDDVRMTHYWDPIASQATLWNQQLKLPAGQLAWDLFVVLARGARWDAAPPPHAYWAHQLNLDVGIKYTPPELRRAVEQALARSGGKGAPPAKPREPAKAP